MARVVGDRASRLGLVVAIALGLAGGLAASSLHAPAVMAVAGSPAPWTGGIDLFRADAYSTQRTWLWCTAADVQIMRNIATGGNDHSKSGQQAYFDYMRLHDRYDLPLKDGVDAAGWTAGLRHFVDARYTLYESRSFDAALDAAVTNLRRTNLPVAITVDHGNHAWIITGFTASADPAETSDFTVTSVSVTGPLWGLQDRAYGYDMKPDTKLTPKQLAGFFTPWHYAPIKMAWEGRWVSIQPVEAPAQGPAPAVIPTAGPPPTDPPAALLDPRAERQPGTGPIAPVRTPIATIAAGAQAAPDPTIGDAPAPGGPTAVDTYPPPIGPWLEAGALALAATAGAWAWVRVRRIRR